MARGQGAGPQNPTSIPTIIYEDEVVPNTIYEDDYNEFGEKVQKPPARMGGPGPGLPHNYVPPPKKKLTPEQEFAKQLNEHPNLDYFAPITQAPKFLTDRAKKIATRLSEPKTYPNELTSEALAAGGVMHPNAPKTKTEASPTAAFAGGAIEGAAELASPLNVALAATGQAELIALRRAQRLLQLGKVAEAGQAARTAVNIERANKLASVGGVVHSADTLTDPESTGMERLQAVPEMAGSLLGLRSRVRPTMESSPIPNLSGQAAAATPDIPMQLGEGGTFTKADVDLTSPVGPTPNTPAPFVPSAITVKVGPKQNMTIATLAGKGFRISGTDQLGNVKMLPPPQPEQPNTFVPEGRMAPPDTAISENRLNELTQQFAEGTTNREIPHDKIGEEKWQALLGKIGGTQKDIVGDQPINLTKPGDDEIAFSRAPTDYPGLEADDTIKSMREIGLAHADELEAKGLKKAADDLRKMYKDTTEAAPDNWMKIIQRDHSEIVDEATRIYQEQDPETISRNHHEYEYRAREMAEAIAGMPVGQPELTQQYANLSLLADIARTKYDRATQRVLEGNMEFARVMDDAGHPIETKDWTPEQLAERKKAIATAWYNVRKRASETGVSLSKVRDIAEAQKLVDAAEKEAGKPQAAKFVAASGLKTEVNITRAIDELTNTYNTPLPGIMVREGLQNAFDAMKTPGSGGVMFNRGSRSVYVTIDSDKLTISDQGKGMTLEQLQTVFKDLNESGKIGEGGATGGKGVGKASYMHGGEHFSATTTVKEGKEIVQYTFGGTPDELKKSYDIEAEIMPKGTSTGTSFTVKFNQKQIDNTGYYWANDMLNKIVKYSRDIPTQVVTEQYGAAITKDIPKFKDDKDIAQVTHDNNDIGIYIPKNEKHDDSSYIELQVLNNGMYQFTQTLYLDENSTVPKNVLVNIKPKMEEGTPEYPFPVNRESVKDDLWKYIRDLVKRAVVEPIQNRARNDLMLFWNDLPGMKGVTTKRNALFFDSGSRLEKWEKDLFLTNPWLLDTVNILDSLLDSILVSSNPGQKTTTDVPIGGGTPVRRITEPDWEKKVKHVGLILDAGINGIHIPHPMRPSEESAVMVNPFNSILSQPPERAVMDIIVTTMHEAGHVGKLVRKKHPQLRDEDLNDPRVGTYLAAYLKEVKEQGGLDAGHGMDFVQRLGDIWINFGTKEAMDYASRLTERLTVPGNPGQYRPEIQRLADIYKESRGRAEVKPDILSRTGIKSAVKGSGANPPSGNTGPTGVGTTRSRTPFNRISLKYEKQPKEEHKNLVKAALDSGYVPTGFRDAAGNPIYERPPDEQTSILAEIWNLPRGSMSVDLPFITSAALRQGATAVFVDPAGWGRAWNNSARAYGSKVAYQIIKDEISSNPYFQRKIVKDKKGRDKEEPSFAEVIGLALTDTNSLTRREEVIKSTWAEKWPLGWGRHVAASNRAYTAFLNTLRASMLVKFTDQMRLDAALLGKPDMDPTVNLVLGKELAELINVLTGRGPGDFEIIPKTRFGTYTLPSKIPLIGGSQPLAQRKISVEGSVDKLANVFFSPRLQASRAKLININTYISASPFIRKMYIRGALSLLAVWGGIAGLAAALGIGDIELDPDSSDFGKIRIGNTRYDPGAGFQQFFVLLHRHFSGEFKSSTSGEEARPMRVGFRPITPGEVAQNFLASKQHPSAKFFYDLEFADTDKPFYVLDRMLQLVAPMFASGLNEVLGEDPLSLPAIVGATSTVTAGSLGIGSQTYEGGINKPEITPLIERFSKGVIPAEKMDIRIPSLEAEEAAKYQGQ